MTDAELDKLVAEKVMGWKPRKPTHGPCCTCQDCGWEKDGCLCYFSPSTDISDAMRVLKRFDNAVMTLGMGTWAVGMRRGADTFSHVEDDSLPRAICLAALKVVGAEAGKEARNG